MHIGMLSSSLGSFGANGCPDSTLNGPRARGVVGSMCAEQLTDDTQPDYAYRPATVAIVNALKPTLRGP